MQEVCIVIPCYNEERRLRRADLVEFVDRHPSFALCLVDDGSRDQTRAVLESLRQTRPEQILVLLQPTNGGKASAVRSGVLHALGLARWPVLGYWDADLSTPLGEAERLLSALHERQECQLVLGSRIKRLGATIERRVMRHIMGRVFASAASWILGLPVYDSQCGAKLFRAGFVETMFRDPFLTRWLFDLEILARLRNTTGNRAMTLTLEVPLSRWQEVGGSKLRMSDFLSVPRELLKIKSHYNR
jgi:glycosyltransferase involved in cell wall biosynthesis